MTQDYDVQAILNDLKQKEEMDPDQHDGSYELMRETIEAYSKLQSFDLLDYHDLNLVYLTTVGTWKQGIDSKKKTINDSHLLPDDKEFLIMLWEETWQKAERLEYSNSSWDTEAKHGSIGMFGTGFFSFQKKTTAEHAKAFIRMCVDILPMTDDDEMFNRASLVLTSSFKGMAAASASMVLHCLKPFTFPIMNSNMGNKNIFEVLGVNLIKTGNIETYIDNCRKIKTFRDQNFSIKNYRIFDMEAWDVSSYEVSASTGFDTRVWLITWNRDNWYWERFAEICEATKTGQSFAISWACASKNPKIGDEVFLIKLGEQPRGIIGHGTVAHEVYDKEHYDARKAADGKKEKAIDVLFDRLINYEHENYVSQDELIAECPTQHWSPQNSGIEIKPEVLPALRALWEKVTNNSNAVFGFDKIISFLSDYKGARYIAPEKADNQKDRMVEMKQRGKEARQRFISFTQAIVAGIPELEYMSCSNWVNQGQTV